MHSKSFYVKNFKAVDDDKGIVEFVASVFGTEDDGGDIVAKGAFKNVIATGRPPKFVPDHNWSVLVRLGKHLGWEEVPEGLKCTTQFNLEKQVARDVYSDFKFAPEEQEFSFSYDIAENGSKKADGIRTITEFSAVYDVGPVGIAMNRDTHLLSVKNNSMQQLLRGASADGGLLFDDHTSLVHSAIEEYTERLKDHRQWLLEKKEGRVLSESNRKRLEDWSQALLQMSKGIKDLLVSTAPKDDELKALDRDFLRLRLRKQAHNELLIGGT